MQREARQQKTAMFSVSAKREQRREDKELERQMKRAGVCPAVAWLSPCFPPLCDASAVPEPPVFVPPP